MITLEDNQPCQIIVRKLAHLHRLRREIRQLKSKASTIIAQEHQDRIDATSILPRKIPHTHIINERLSMKLKAAVDTEQTRLRKQCTNLNQRVQRLAEAEKRLQIQKLESESTQQHLLVMMAQELLQLRQEESILQRKCTQRIASAFPIKATSIHSRWKICGKTLSLKEEPRKMTPALTYAFRFAQVVSRFIGAPIPFSLQFRGARSRIRHHSQREWHEIAPTGSHTLGVPDMDAPDDAGSDAGGAVRWTRRPMGLWLLQRMVWLVALHAALPAHHPLDRDAHPVTANPLQCLGQFSAANQQASHVRWWHSRLRERTPLPWGHPLPATSPLHAREVRHDGSDGDAVADRLASEPCSLDDDDWDLV